MALTSELMAAGMPAGQANQIGNNVATSVAGAGTTQADAASLVGSDFVYLTGANNSGVILPTASGNGDVAIYNGSGQTIKLYAALTETINNQTSSTAFSITNAKSVICKPAGNGWIVAMSA